MAGFESLGQLIAGSPAVAGEEGRLEGLDFGSRIRARQASTESALALARQRRDENVAKAKLSELFADDPELAGLFQSGIDPRQLSGFRGDEQVGGFRDVISDVGLPFGERQAAAQAIEGKPLSASDFLGPGGELAFDVFSEPSLENFQVTPTGEAQIGFDTERAKLAKEKRLHPERFKSSSVFNIGTGGQGLGDIILEDIGDSTIPADIKPEQATGVTGALKSAANIAFDVFNANLPFPDTDTAANALKDLMVRTQITGQQSIPGRPSNFLMQQLATFGVEPNNPFKADQRSLNRMVQTSRFLTGEVDRLRRRLNAGRLTPTKVVEAEDALRSVGSLLNDYNVTISRFNAEEAQNTAAGGSFTVEDDGT